MKQTPREAREALINSYKSYLETIRERVETIASVNNDEFTKQVLIESAYSFIKQVDNYGHKTIINHFYKSLSKPAKKELHKLIDSYIEVMNAEVEAIKE